MNRHYNLNLTCKAATKNEEIVFDFDPYNDCSDFADLRELAAAETGSLIKIFLTFKIKKNGKNNASF